MLNIPPVHQRLIVELDVLVAKDLPQLGDGLVELAAGRVGRDTGQLAFAVAARHALGECAVAEQAGFGFRAEGEKAVREARVGVGQSWGWWDLGGRGEWHVGGCEWC